MWLVLREMRRAVVRFGLLIGAIGLLVFLILFQQSLSTGLITGFVGGVRNQSAPVLVYSVDAQRALQASIIPAPLEEQIRTTRGVGRAAPVTEGTFTVRVGGADAPDSDAAILGTDDAELFHPTTLSAGHYPTAAGEAVGSDADFSVGDTVEVVPGGGADPVTITVVGVASDLQIGVTATLFTDLETFGDAARAANPGITQILPNVMAVRPAAGVSVDQVVTAINSGSPDLEALSRDDAADKSPGVAQVRQSFRVIFLLYGLVVPLVTGLFFLIVTLQKSGALTLLRAIGARSAVLARSLLLQVTVVIGAGLAVGVALFYPVSQMRVGGLTLRFDPTVVLGWAAVLMVLGLLSALASLRRVLAIDPIDATTGEGVR